MTESRATSLRILCLHDANSNAAHVHETLKDLDRRLYQNHKVELVFINSPLLQTDDDSDDDQYVWWEDDTKEYTGLDASLLHVRQVINSVPFSGVLAFGQGAALASLLPFMGTDLEFGVFIHGHALLEEEERLVKDWPCLHIVHSKSARRLIAQFGGEVHESETQQLRNVDLNAIGKFVVQQKKRLRGNDAGALTLQNQLHVIEQAAAQVVAQAVAENPPKALMAVISPRTVGGWSGKKRQEQGGGAPCPSEFLLRKGARAREDDGANREHPDNE